MERFSHRSPEFEKTGIHRVKNLSSRDGLAMIIFLTVDQIDGFSNINAASVIRTAECSVASHVSEHQFACIFGSDRRHVRDKEILKELFIRVSNRNDVARLLRLSIDDRRQ